MNHADILDKYITVVEAYYHPGDYDPFYSFSEIGHATVEFNHPRLFHKGKKQIDVYIYFSHSVGGRNRLITPNDEPFDVYPFIPFVKYLGISENDINSWVIDKYLKTLVDQRVDVYPLVFLFDYGC